MHQSVLEKIIPPSCGTPKGKEITKVIMNHPLGTMKNSLYLVVVVVVEILLNTKVLDKLTDGPVELSYKQFFL